MKKLIVILGPSAVGKSSVCKSLLERTQASAWVDGDWCRQINPYPFTNKTKKTVTENLYCLIRNYLLCEEIQWVIFPYSLHGEQEGIFRALCERLDKENLDVQVHTVVLKASMEEIIRRGKADGRTQEQIERGIMESFYLYDDMNLPTVDTTELTAEETAEAVWNMIGQDPVPLPKKKQNLRPLLGLLVIPLILCGVLLGRCTAPKPMTRDLPALTQPTETAATEPSIQPTQATTQATEPPTEAVTEITEPPTEAESETTEPAVEESTEAISAAQDYVVNKSSKKFHYPHCESVGKMKESNKEFVTATREALLDRGCDPCGNCNP